MGCCLPKDSNKNADLEGQHEAAAARNQSQPLIENSTQPASPNTQKKKKKEKRNVN